MGYLPRPVRSADAPVLLELVADLRRTLGRRGEALPATWPEEAVADLKSGRMGGLLLEGPEGPTGLGILSVRARRAFAQAHLLGATEPVTAAEILVRALVEAAPPSAERVDAGVSGLTGEEELLLGDRLAARPGFETVRRLGLIRPVTAADGTGPPAVPEGYRFHPAGAIPTSELSRVDWEAFRHGPDAAFVADDPESNARLLDNLRAGQLGQFLDIASAGVVDEAGHLVGFLLCVEESPRVGVIVDVAVGPASQRRGIGAALLAHALRALLALGYERARLWVTETNAPALRLYQRTGFRPETTSYIYRWRRGDSAPEASSPHRAR
ncbi:MAG: GNAT family N-acetyltransferase [Thermoplasmata archaeon]